MGSPGQPTTARPLARSLLQLPVFIINANQPAARSFGPANQSINPIKLLDLPSVHDSAQDGVFASLTQRTNDVMCRSSQPDTNSASMLHFCPVHVPPPSLEHEPPASNTPSLEHEPPASNTLARVEWPASQNVSRVAVLCCRNWIGCDCVLVFPRQCVGGARS